MTPQPRLITSVIRSRAEAARVFDFCLDPEDAPAGDPVVTEPGSFGLCEGMFIGRYRLISQLGEGGFGVVWLAEQSVPLQRLVAMKVIKPGMDSREVIARFENEREALAVMDHPNVCKVLDAGATAAGRPYVVMDLVRGTPLTEYCDQKTLPLKDRLTLFVEVCRGVQHAHQKAILHRDLKPSNILVVEIDGEPVPKIIDFGIAKALGAVASLDAQPKASITRAGTIVGTPEYMSPEQAELGADTDVLSDIYSLGAILYELLTGPPRLATPADRNLSFRELLHRIAIHDPIRPSAKLAARVPEERRNAAVNRRCASPGELEDQLSGDLDWITLKALERDKKRRYESAAALAADLELHLEDRPVRACPPSRAYVISKWIRRHRAAFVTTIIVAAGLLLGAAFGTWSYLDKQMAIAESKGALLKAQTESENSDRVAKFLEGVFGEMNLRNNQTMTAEALRELLNAADKRRRSEFQVSPKMDLRVSQTLANSYCELNHLSAAEELYSHALDCLRKLGAEDSLEAADCMYWIGWTRLRRTEETDTAGQTPQHLALVERSRQIIAARAPGNDEARARVTALLAGIHRAQGDLTTAVSLLNEVTAGTAAPEARFPESYGRILRQEALVAAARGNFAGALEMIDRARTFLLAADRTPNRTHQVKADLLRLTRHIQQQAGNLEEAERAAEAELDERSLWLGYDDPGALTFLAEIYLITDREDLAVAKLRLAIEIAKRYELHAAEEQALRVLVDNQDRLGQNTPAQRLILIAELARVILLQGDAAHLAKEDDTAYLTRAERLVEKLPIELGPEAARLLAVRAKIAARRADYTEAVLQLRNALELDRDNAQYESQAAQFALAAKDLPTFESYREELLRSVDGQSDQANLTWIARAVLLHSVPDRKMLAEVRTRMEQMTLRAGEDDGWTALLNGMLEFRSGERDEALTLRWLEYAQRSRNPAAAVQALAVTSLYYASSDPARARDFLQQAHQKFEARLAPYWGTEALVPLEDLVATHLLLEEARAGIQAQP